MNIIDVALLDSCQNSCSYCINKSLTVPHIPHTKMFQSLGVLLHPRALMNFIFNNFKQNECIIQLSGGEPLLHPSFIDICYQLISNNYKVIVNTNGKLIKDMKELDKNILKLPISWRISYHPDFISKDIFREIVNNLKDNKVLVNYVALPLKILDKRIDNDILFLSTLNCPYEITAFQGEWNEQEWNKSDRLYDKYLTANNNKLPAIPCSYYSISAHGIVSACFKNKLGNIYDGTFKRYSPDSNKVCQRNNGNTACGLIESMYHLGVI